MSAVAASQGDIVLRRMNAEDLPAVLHVQRRCYPDHLIESLDALASRQRLSPDTCWVAARQNALLGYLFAHPWRGDQPPSLNQPLRALPEAGDTLFIHDLALHPQARGHGLGPKLVGQALRQGRKLGLRHSRLVAVEGAAAWWRKHGYRGYALPHYPLNGYGDGAVSMQCEL
ncbi:GNAT family N-acetyltransferase [Chromobacterium sp. IIBBL 290-4]|uniref:GNAT family N-acetyltransferase n=1 Tax=Chromobacterium sp. IIBBL 290-4 TaxID=2953890 RepID=UPI0020B827F5|nr:N-acetyltransferase [Chromobacterium sp. IIBBL 290-4]UTH75377.1 GNAT family N-acetyltransferase [Chromobacterium sp. IIBBL 290-4]